MRERRSPLREHELDIAGNCFGIRFVDGGSPNGLFEIYIEDDENWHYKCCANNLWLKDLAAVVDKAIKEKL